MFVFFNGSDYDKRYAHRFSIIITERHYGLNGMTSYGIEAMLRS